MNIANEKIIEMRTDLIKTWNKLHKDITLFNKEIKVRILTVILERALRNVHYAIQELEVALDEVEIECKLQKLYSK